MSTTICTILGAIATVAMLIYLYTCVLPERKSNSLSGFLKKLRGFLKFQKLYIESVLRFLYVLATVSCVCFGFFRLFGVSNSWYGSSSTFLSGLFMIIAGPIITRVIFELTMMTFLLVTNVIAINNKLSGNNSDIEFASENLFADKLSEKVENAAAIIKQQRVDKEANRETEVSSSNSDDAE